MLLIVLYGCEIWSLTLRQEHRLTVSENIWTEEAWTCRLKTPNEELQRPRRRWNYNIKMNLRDIWSNMDWTDLAQDRGQWRAPVNMVMNLRVPLNVEKFLSSCATGGFSRRAQLHAVGWLDSLLTGRQGCRYLAEETLNLTWDRNRADDDSQTIRLGNKKILWLHSFINGSTVLCWALAAFFQFRNPIHTR
jgi:hypothetical protein